LANAPLLKSPNGNVKMAIYFDTINLVGNYMVVNELKAHTKISHFKQFFNVLVKKQKLKSTQK
jgi:hypothetical protein